MSTTLSAQERDQLLNGLPGYPNGTQSPFQIAPASNMSQIPGYAQYSAYGGVPVPHKAGDHQRNSIGYENIDPLFGHSSTTYDQNYAMAQNSNSFFPTPPLSSYVPNFFESSNFSAQALNHRSVQTPRRLQFGSDARFEGQTFIAPPEQETPETLIKRKMNHLDCLKPEPSPASTHPSSPVQSKKSRHPITHITEHQAPTMSTTYDNNQDPDIWPPETPVSKPRKRRKADPDSDPDFEASRKPSRQSSKRSKGSSTKKTPTTPKKPPREDSTPKSRPSSAKPARQHLSEEQKKTNHIISEQKRRDLIKNGYEGIRQMVPQLQEMKYSKGAMLEMAADWLDDIVRCNGDLRAQLQAMK